MVPKCGFFAWLASHMDLSSWPVDLVMGVTGPTVKKVPFGGSKRGTAWITWYSDYWFGRSVSMNHTQIISNKLSNTHANSHWRFLYIWTMCIHLFFSSTGWRSTLTVLLICSTFSKETWSSLICSSPSARFKLDLQGSHGVTMNYPTQTKKHHRQRKRCSTLKFSVNNICPTLIDFSPFPPKKVRGSK